MDLPPDTEYKGPPKAVYSRVDTSEAARGKVDLTKEYSAKHQLHTFWQVILGFIINGVLWGSYAFAAWYTSTLGPLDKNKEDIWNVIGVGLPLLIGLHTSVGARRSWGTCLSKINNILVGLQKNGSPDAVAGAGERLFLSQRGAARTIMIHGMFLTKFLDRRT